MTHRFAAELGVDKNKKNPKKKQMWRILHPLRTLFYATKPKNHRAAERGKPVAGEHSFVFFVPYTSLSPSPDISVCPPVGQHDPSWSCFSVDVLWEHLHAVTPCFPGLHNPERCSLPLLYLQVPRCPRPHCRFQKFRNRDAECSQQFGAIGALCPGGFMYCLFQPVGAWHAYAQNLAMWRKTHLRRCTYFFRGRGVLWQWRSSGIDRPPSSKRESRTAENNFTRSSQKVF